MPAVDDVLTYLESQGLAGGATGWTVLRRRLMDSPAPDQLIVVSEDGGSPPEIAVSSGLGEDALSDPGVLVTVRAGAWDGDASRAKAQAIHSALHGIRSTALVSGGTVYLGIRAMTPEPVFVGFDSQGRPLHTIAFRLLTVV